MFLAEGDTHGMLTTAVTALAGGTLLLVAARRAGLPAIVLLLGGGIAFGPELMGLVQPELLGDGLLVLVELAVGLILFEGGLTLNLQGYRTAPTMIKRLLSLGVVITWLATACALKVFVPLPWMLAIVSASLVIVTGPTVIAPILKRIRVTPRVHAILHWESVLIDPIGVFIAVLCFEWMGPQAGSEAIINLLERSGTGMAVGLAGGGLLILCVTRRIVPADMINVFALASAVLVFGVSEAIISKSGLLSVAVAGFCFGLSRPAEVRQVRRFKAEITDLLIATLFILLAARLELSQFTEFGVGGAIAVAVVMLVVRPLSIFISGIGLDVTTREKLFLSWMAPRGIVAASLASLFAISLEQRGMEQARMVETFTYSVILATICIQGLTAGSVARWLGVRQPEPTGWLIVGGNAFAQRVASFIRSGADRSAVIIDTNAQAVHEAMDQGLHAIRADARDIEIADRHELTDIGNVLALTDNEDLNARVCGAWSEIVGSEHTYRCLAARRHPGQKPDDGAPGGLVWPDLPRPNIVAAELAAGTTSIFEIHGQAESPPGAVTIASYDGKRVRLSGEHPEGPDVRRLLIRRESDHLVRALRPEFVLIDAGASTIEELVPQMLTRIGLQYPDLPIADVAREVIERERVFPTRIGAGVAVPHTYSPDVGRQVCALARVDGGVTFGSEAADAEPTRLVFLVVSRPNDAEGHLALLAQIARVVSEETTRNALLAAATPDDMMELIARRT